MGSPHERGCEYRCRRPASEHAAARQVVLHHVNSLGSRVDLASKRLVRPAGAWCGRYLRLSGNQCGATMLRLPSTRRGAVRRREQPLVAKLLAVAGLQLAIIPAQREGLGQIADDMAVAWIVENGEHLLSRLDEYVERVAH